MKVLIADDHPLVRDALSRAVRVLDPQATISEAVDHAAVEWQLAAGLPDLVVIDLNMPGMLGGAAGLRRLRERHPSLPIVVISGENDPATIREVLATGMSGFIPKTEPSEVLLQALRLVLSGGRYLPASVLDAQSRPPSVTGNLTPRQLDVLRLLMRGEPNKLIARALDVAEGTVKIHIAAILRALQARNRTEAVVMARALGIDEFSDSPQ